MLIATSHYNLPHAVIGLQYLNFEGKKISKSQKIGVFCDRLMELGENPDVWRFYLTFALPEYKDSNFSWEDFEERVNKDLIGNYLNLVNRVISMVWKKLGRGELRYAVDKDVKEFLEKKLEEYCELMDSFRQRDALAKVLEISDFGNKYFQEREPWKLNDIEEVERILANTLQVVKVASVLIYPFVPRIAGEVLSLIGESVLEISIDSCLEEKDKWIVGKPRIIVPKVEVSKDKKRELANVKNLAEYVYERCESLVRFEEFSRLDLRVGKILEANPIGEKLYLLKISFGEEVRNVVAGVRKWIKEEELIGKCVIVLKNIVPRKLRGVLSEGMVLFCEKGDRVYLLDVDCNLLGGKLRKRVFILMSL